MPRPTTEKPISLTRALCRRCMSSFEYDGGGPDEGGKASTRLCPACENAAGESVRNPRVVETASRSRRGPSRHVEAAGSSRASALLEDMKDWCAGRAWWARCPLWAYLGYTLLRYFAGSESYRSVFDAINLGIHELGHYLFSYFGQFLHVAGGTIVQCAAPVLSGVMFLKQRDYFAISVCLFWLGTNLAYVAVYMADARALKLPLVSPGMGVLPPGDGGVLHDWNHLFGVTGLIPYDTAIAALVQVVAVGFMLAGLGVGAWLMLRMMRGAAGSPSVGA